MLTLPLAMMSGVTLVNVYYGYYQIWGGPSADLTNSYSHFHHPALARARQGLGRPRRDPAADVDRQAQRHLRAGYVYLPPRYFERAYTHTRFPVVELVHGSPAARWTGSC